MFCMYNEFVIFYVSFNCCSSVVEWKLICVILEGWGKNILDFFCFMDLNKVFLNVLWVDKVNEIEKWNVRFLFFKDLMII